jgi:hypothetical protein
MMDISRCLVRVWRCSALAQFPVFVALMAVACSVSPLSSYGSGSSSSNGGTASSGGSGSGGVSSSSGSASGGALGIGGAAGIGGSGSGGVSGTGGRSGVRGTGGSTSSGAGGTGPVRGATGPGGSSGAVPSVGCGKDSMVTFAAVPGESGTNVGTGDGGYVKIGSRGFAMRLPDNYDKNKPYW